MNADDYSAYHRPLLPLGHHGFAVSLGFALFLAGACDAAPAEVSNRGAKSAAKSEPEAGTKPETKGKPGAKAESDAASRPDATAEPRTGTKPDVKAEPNHRDMRPYAAQLAELTVDQEDLDVNATLKLFDEAMNAFVAARPGLDPDNAEAQRAAIDALLLWMDDRAGKQTPGDIDGLSSNALEHATGHKPEAPPTTDDLARIAELSNLGVGFYWGDEAIDTMAVDYATVRERLAPALSEAGLAYIEAIAWERDEIGIPSPAWVRLQAGGPKGDPELLALWEELAGKPEGKAWRATEHGRAVLQRYLERCAAIEHTYFLECTVSASLRKSYEDFLAAHPRSIYRDAIATFLASVEAKGFRIQREKKFDAIVAEAMAKVSAGSG